MSVETILEIILTALVAETMGKEVDFTSFYTVFQSDRDDGRVIVTGCVHWIRSARGATTVVAL